MDVRCRPMARRRPYAGAPPPRALRESVPCRPLCALRHRPYNRVTLPQRHLGIRLQPARRRRRPVNLSSTCAALAALPTVCRSPSQTSALSPTVACPPPRRSRSPPSTPWTLCIVDPYPLPFPQEDTLRCPAAGKGDPWVLQRAPLSASERGREGRPASRHRHCHALNGAVSSAARPVVVTFLPRLDLSATLS